MANRVPGAVAVPPTATDIPPLPTGLRAAWRGLTTLLLLGFQSGRGLFVFVFAVHTASQLLFLFVVYSTKLVIDAALAGDAPGLLLAAGAMAGAQAAGLILGHLYVSSTMQLEETANPFVDRQLMRIVGGVRGLEHEERPEYLDQLAQLRAERRLLGHVANTVVLMTRVAIRIVGGTAMLATLHPALILMPLFGVPPFLAARRATEIARRTSESMQGRSREARHLFEKATAADAGKELRLFGLAKELISRHARLSDGMLRDGDAADWKGAMLNVGGAVCFAVGYTGAIGLVLWRALNGDASAGDLVLVAALAAEMSHNVAIGVQEGNYFLRALHSTTRYLWLKEYEEAARRRWADLPPARVPDRLTDGITLESVSFCYPGTENQALRDVSLVLPAGAVVALVGENGAGKTTLIKLLKRFYEPASGRILVDGVDLRRLDVEAWRRRTSAAFQDFRQFEFLLKETVGVGDLPALSDDERVRGALARAGGEELEGNLGHGLETQLGKSWAGGVDLSGGQWQKLALARAFMREAPLLVTFDEPTAAIDAPTEHALFERLAAAARSGASRGTVTLIVSHRFSTVRMADVILVLDDGHIRERGTHAELMRLGGIYAELYELQARAYK